MVTAVGARELRQAIFSLCASVCISATDLPSSARAAVASEVSETSVESGTSKLKEASITLGRYSKLKLDVR